MLRKEIRAVIDQLQLLISIQIYEGIYFVLVLTMCTYDHKVGLALLR